MMHRSIPPRTMSDVSRERHARPPTRQRRDEDERPYTVRPVRVPPRATARQAVAHLPAWSVDLFVDHDAVRIVVDLGGWARDEVQVNLDAARCTISAVRGTHMARELLALPDGLDVGAATEHWLHGVLEIVIPRGEV